jgi:hypothetical protein
MFMACIFDERDRAACIASEPLELVASTNSSFNFLAVSLISLM